MSEEAATAAAESAGGPDTGGLALDFAMEEARSDPSLREDVAAFLRNQNSLIDVQKHHLIKQFRLGLWEKRLGVMLRVATGVMGLALASLLGVMVSQASHSNGLLIEPFSVPPDLAQRGLTGEVVAARVLDRLNLMQSQTDTSRPAMSYSNAWGEHGIKLEISETGISLSELDNWLRAKLGNDIRVSGEIVRTATGVTITARAGDEAAESISGPDADVDALAGRLAESIYRITQPYRYAVFLLRHENRAADALPIFKRLALNGSPDDRLWSYNMWAVTMGALHGPDVSLAMYQKAVAVDPDSIGTYENLTGALGARGRSEEMLQTYRAMFAHLNNGRQTYVPADKIPAFRTRGQARLDIEMGAYRDAMPVFAELARTGVPGLPTVGLMATYGRTQAGAHELSAARATMADMPIINTRNLSLQIAFQGEDWPRVAGHAGEIADAIAKDPNIRNISRTLVFPYIAYGEARLGKITQAEARIAVTPPNCYVCLRVRGRIAELRGQHGRADYWFARAESFAPSFPFAFMEHGLALADRGQWDAAIAKYANANQKSPRFADPLVYWGEALTKKGQAHLALEKFAEAEKYAPNWGRLHIKWGEALLYTGKPDEAKAQFTRAAQLDLTPSEKSELIKVRP